MLRCYGCRCDDREASGWYVVGDDRGLRLVRASVRCDVDAEVTWADEHPVEAKCQWVGAIIDSTAERRDRSVIWDEYNTLEFGSEDRPVSGIGATMSEAGAASTARPLAHSPRLERTAR